MNMDKLVIASGNAGKVREFRLLCEPLGLTILTQFDLGIVDADEPHCTFVENALAKARHASRASGLPALADDSGICVAALGGAPGVHSARFCAPNEQGARFCAPNETGARFCAPSEQGARLATDDAPAGATQDARNNAKLIRMLEGTANRRAHYTCVLVLVRHADDPEPIIAEGRWDGEIIAAPRGEGGFGYDPHFYLPALDKTAAQLPPAVKNGISHRGQALALLAARLRRGVRGEA